MAERAVSSFLFFTTSIITELLIPTVARDFNIVPKFLKLPKSAIPAGPKKTEMTLVDKIPSTKLNPTEIEFSESTLKNKFSLSFKSKGV